VLEPHPTAPAEAQQLSVDRKLDKATSGFYRMKIGTIDVIALSDGTADLKFSEMLSTKEAEKLLARAYCEIAVDASGQAFLIPLWPAQILVDTGSGDSLDPN